MSRICLWNSHDRSFSILNQCFVYSDHLTCWCIYQILPWMTSFGSISGFQESPSERKGLRTRVNFQPEFVFFFLLEMLKMFTSPVITFLWHHGLAWRSPVTPLCTCCLYFLRYFCIFPWALFAKLYCSAISNHLLCKFIALSISSDEDVNFLFLFTFCLLVCESYHRVNHCFGLN